MLSNGHNLDNEESVRYVKSSTLSNERKNKWALQSSAKEQIGPKRRFRGQVGPLIFSLIRKSRRFYISNNERNRTDSSQVTIFSVRTP